MLSRLFCCTRLRKKILIDATIAGDLATIKDLNAIQFAGDKYAHGITLFDIACKFKHQHVLDHFYLKAIRPIITKSFSLYGIDSNTGAFYLFGTDTHTQRNTAFDDPSNESERNLGVRLGFAVVYNQLDTVNSILEKVKEKGWNVQNFLNNKHYQGHTPLQLARIVCHEKLIERFSAESKEQSPALKICC